MLVILFYVLISICHIILKFTYLLTYLNHLVVYVFCVMFVVRLSCLFVSFCLFFFLSINKIQYISYLSVLVITWVVMCILKYSAFCDD